MNKYLYLLSLFVFISCGSSKKANEALNTGNYYNAINTSIAKLADNKTRKSNQQYITILEDAFTKNVQRELERINFLKKENNPANYAQIYDLYMNLNDVQERIKPLLPLYLNDENREATFNFKSYSDQILGAKTKLASYLYDNASNLLNNAVNKYDYRKAYDDLTYLDELNPNYKDVHEKIELAYNKGLDYVVVDLINDTDKVLPRQLEDDLLNFNTYGLNDLWTVYHTNPQRNMRYDYELRIKFNDILISPEQVSEKEIIKEKQVKDGWEYLTGDDGKVVKDSLGNAIKVDKYRTVTCNFYRFSQHKDVQIAGTVSYFDLQTKQQINSYPLASGFVFENDYANYRGDKRALDDSLTKLLSAKAVPFPSNEQMIYDAGEDLKNKIKSILIRYKFN
ncbi:MAG: hypothetical protein KDC69_08225 [Flavobacteriaceae bacterium]|nr:hypothetical protein [Flavobacteriaceae bacterium]